MTFTDNPPWTESIPEQWGSRPQDIYVPTPKHFAAPLPRDYDNPQIQEVVNKVRVQYGEHFIHPPESVYLNLTVKQQRIMSIIRRGGKKAPKSLLRKMKPATKDDYQMILLNCIEALVHAWMNTEIRLDRVQMFMEVPFNYRKRYKNFPRPFICGFRDWSLICAFKCDTMIDWLYEKGYSGFTAKELRKNLWSILQEQEKLEWAYQYYAPISIVETYEEVIKAPRKEKGKGKNASNRLLLKNVKPKGEEND